MSSLLNLPIKAFHFKNLSSFIYTPVAPNGSNSELFDDTERDLPQDLTPPSTPIGTKIKKIKEGRTSEALSKKKRTKNNKSIKDWWIWYWQAPMARFPLLYFLVTLLFSIASCIYWFMDNDSAFISCGIVGVPMCAYAIHKFRISIKLKQQIDHYKSLNAQFKRENRQLNGSIERAKKAYDMLKHTKARLKRANNKNRHNLKKFIEVEHAMKIVGEQTVTELKTVNALTEDIKRNWRNELLNNERQMLHAVFNRYETTHGNTTSLGMNENDYTDFKAMLPLRYQKRFDQLGTFDCYSGGLASIHYDDFVNALDTFALMETDDRDIEITTPLSSVSQPIDIFSRKLNAESSCSSDVSSPYSAGIFHRQMPPIWESEDVYKLD